MELDERHFSIMRELGLPADLSELTDEEAWCAADDAVYDEMVTRCLTESGDGLTERGVLCEDILSALAEM